MTIGGTLAKSHDDDNGNRGCMLALERHEGLTPFGLERALENSGCTVEWIYDPVTADRMFSLRITNFDILPMVIVVSRVLTGKDDAVRIFNYDANADHCWVNFNVAIEKTGGE